MRRLVLRRQRTRRPPGRFSLSLATVMQVLYPCPLPGDLHLDDEALDAAGSLRVEDLGTVRRVLAALDGPSAPSPVLVRFGPDDLVEVDLGDRVMVLDRADSSVSQEIIAWRSYEPGITAQIARHLGTGMTFVDVGANVGYFSILASRLVGPSGRVVAVEPSSENCRLLLLSIERNRADNIELCPVAAGARRGWAHLSHHIGSNASLVDPTGHELRRGYGTVVPVFPLDQLVLGPVDLVKIDVEGAEGLAMTGARRLIEASRPVIVTEGSEEMLQRVSAVSLHDYLSWFASIGYRVFLVEPTISAEPTEVAVDDLIARWDDPFRIANFLLLPA